MKIRTVYKENKYFSGIVKYLIFLTISVLFILCFSLWTSPLYKNWYGCDCSFFTMVGRGITEGLVPYKDFFDLKGPYFFFIEALGQLLHEDRLGSAMIQMIFMSFTLSIMWEMARLYLRRGKSVAVMIIFLIGQISIMWGGNTLEEYMLPLNLLVMFISVRFLKDNSLKNSEVPYYIPLITGICFGIITFSKITVGAPVMGIALTFGISLLAYKKFKGLLMYCLYFLLGFLIAVFPIFVYFAFHNCLLYMLYCVFDFAFKRGTDFSDPFSFDWEVRLVGCYFAFLFGIFHFPYRGSIKNTKAFRSIASIIDAIRTKVKSNRNSNDDNNKNNDNNKINDNNTNNIIISSSCEGSSVDELAGRKHILAPELSMMLVICSILTYLLLHLGNPFIYYFMTVTPVMILALILLLKMYDPLILFTNTRQAICLILVGIFLFDYGQESYNTICTFVNERTENNYYQDYYDSAIELAKFIPQFERGDVFSFDTDMTWFEANRIMPCYKYQINLQFFIHLDPRIEDDIMERFDSNPPKWLITSSTLSDYLPEIFDMVVEKYDFIYSNMSGYLYILKE